MLPLEDRVPAKLLRASVFLFPLLSPPLTQLASAVGAAAARLPLSLRSGWGLAGPSVLCRQRPSASGRGGCYCKRGRKCPEGKVSILPLED